MNQDYPCANCDDCVPIGEGDGLCEYCNHSERNFLVDLFAIYPFCPKKKDEEMFRKRRLENKR